MNIPSVGIKEATKVTKVTKSKTAAGTFDHKQLSGIKRGGASQEFRKPDTRVSFTVAATWRQFYTQRAEGRRNPAYMT